MGVRCEYRRRYDSQAAITQDPLDEIDAERQRQLSQASEPSPGPQPRPQVTQTQHNGNGHNGHTVPPWEELEVVERDNMRPQLVRHQVKPRFYELRPRRYKTRLR